MSKAYHITQWDDANETNESRKFVNLNWYAKRNKLDGLGIGRLRAHARRVELLAGWTLIETLASRAWPKHQRGWLLRNGVPLTTADMAFLTSFPEEIFTLTVEFCMSDPVRWLEYKEVPKWVAESAGDKPRPSGAPAESAGDKPRPSGAPAESETQTDRQTGKTDRQTSGEKKKDAARGGDVAASRTRFAALRSQVKVLDDLGTSITPAQRQELRKKRAELSDLQRRQGEGDFSVQTPGAAAP